MSGIGHIGELQIMDFLEKEKGVGIYLPLKDRGIDFIALKENTAYKIQVKTSKFQKNSYFWFDLSIKKMIYSENTFYIFVPYTLPRRTLMGKNKNFLVVPSLRLGQWISSGEMVTKERNEDIINVFVYPDFEAKTWTYRNKGKEIPLTEFWNNFSPFD